MKNILRISFSISFAAMAMLLLPGCKKFLEREPLGRYTLDDLGASSIESQVFAMYAGLRTEGMSGIKFIAVHSIRSDDADKGSIPSDNLAAETFFDEFNYTKDFWLLNDYWGDHYRLIKLTNDVIDAVEKLDNPNAAEIVNRAEAKFLRAYAYFNLVRAFGQVPKIDFLVENVEDGNKPKATVEDIYALIDADLQEAAANLPPSWEPRFIGRTTKWAAKALQAKAFITRGNWSGALAAAKEVIDSKVYSLHTPYVQLFSEVGENSAESIFEIQAFYSSTQDFGIQYAEVQGVRGSGVWDLGFGWNTPTQDLADAFEPNDPRKNASIMPNNSPDPYGVNGVITSQSQFNKLYYNRKTYTNPNVRNTIGGGNPRKGRWMNLRVIRYADVLLWAAEAANELGGTQNVTDALTWLELVRNRARQGAPAGTLPAVTTTDKDQLRTAIRHERRVEFGMENERFYDLVRWGTAQEVFNALGKNYQPRNRYLPIPQPEIDKSNGVLIQNPDYQ